MSEAAEGVPSGLCCLQGDISQRGAGGEGNQRRQGDRWLGRPQILPGWLLYTSTAFVYDVSLCVHTHTCSYIRICKYAHVYTCTCTMYMYALYQFLPLEKCSPLCTHECMYMYVHVHVKMFSRLIIHVYA